MQGIRADAPEEAGRLAATFRDAVGAGSGRCRRSPPADRESLLRLLETGVKAHTETLLRIAPLLAPFSGLVPQTRVRIRATGSVNYGRSIPTYPEEWGGGKDLPDNRDLRDAWPEGVTLPRAINYNLGCTTLGLPAVVSDLAALDKRAAVLLERHVPGYREILASELPYFVRESVALVFGETLAETTAQAVPPGRRRRSGSTRACARRSSRRPASSRCSTSATSPRSPTAGTRRRSTRA